MLWTGDEQRCGGAGVPEARQFAMKPELATSMMPRILAGDAPIAWVAADEAYGPDTKSRAACLHQNVGYVVAVPRSQHVTYPRPRLGTYRIETLAAQASPEAWLRISTGNGTKGPRLYGWATARIGAWWDEENRTRHWVLIRRRLTDPPIWPSTCARDRWNPRRPNWCGSGARWAIEECLQPAKNHTGLDQYEVRSYTG